ncbi:MAG: LysR family transcriptional regulator [Acidobacteria bacterium]|nr:MAG: LysR family transcriptional regulator [Acidobacteriota bacterium]
MALEDRELRSFLVLAEQLHFGRAANLLHISQPALSKQIKGVEEKLGGPLLVRNRRDVRLTAAGTLLYGEARRIVRDLDSLFDATQAAVRGEAGRLRVAVGIATIHSLVPPALRKFREAHPRVEIQIGDMSTPRQIEALLAGEVDVGFLRLPIRRAELAVKKVLKEQLTIAASSSFRGALTLEKIAHEPFIVIGREVSTTYYDHCIRLCGSAGFSPRVVQEARDTFTLLNLVRAGIGVALVPRSARQMRVSGVRFSDINRREAEWDVGVAWHKLHESALVRNFVEICLAVA